MASSESETSFGVLNPYRPHPFADAEVLSDFRPQSLAPRISLLGISLGLVMFAVGILWIRVLAGSSMILPDVVLHYTLAESLAFGGMSIAIVLATRIAFIRLRSWATPPSASNGTTAVFGLNVVAAGVSMFFCVLWLIYAVFGAWMLAVEIRSWDYIRGFPLMEVSLQSLLYGSVFAASVCCLVACRHWVCRNRRRAGFYSLIGWLGPVAALLVLFRVCEPLIRWLL